MKASLYGVAGVGLGVGLLLSASLAMADVPGSGLWAEGTNSLHPATTTDQVIIGSATASNSAVLDVEGSAYAKNNVSVGAYNPTVGSMFWGSEVFNSQRVFGILSQPTMNNTSSTVGSVFGAWIVSTVGSTTTHMTGAVGLRADATVQAGASMSGSDLWSEYMDISNNSATASLEDMGGLKIYNPHTSGPVEDVYGIEYLGATVTGSGSIENEGAIVIGSNLSAAHNGAHLVITDSSNPDVPTGKHSIYDSSVLPSYIAGTVTFGSSAAPKGITLYDTATQQPFCVQVTNGALVSTAGACN
jgi:hypothetical protein